jgi:hypothetical protein
MVHDKPRMAATTWTWIKKIKGKVGKNRLGFLKIFTQFCTTKFQDFDDDSEFENIKKLILYLEIKLNIIEY